ncbi:hypothetical protein RHO12_01805 [Orbus sturtevantii]|uniref:hypothetical protein n=1 Tax=Orbus sturtevantii TaxID=3074109 RepID=UPI00370DAC5F
MASTYLFLFDTNPLGNAKINPAYVDSINQFYQVLAKKLGIITRKQCRLYRIPTHEQAHLPYQQYALIALSGEQSDCLIEIVCNDTVNTVIWPKESEIVLGKRLTIEVADWIDAYLLITDLMKEDR